MSDIDQSGRSEIDILRLDYNVLSSRNRRIQLPALVVLHCGISILDARNGIPHRRDFRSPSYGRGLVTSDP